MKKGNYIMGIAINSKNKSTSYIGSFKLDCSEDLKELQSVKRMVAWANRSMVERGDPYRYRVCLRGRYAKEKMIATATYGNQQNATKVAYNWHGNIVGGLANAKEVRCYIYKRA